jgi:Protein of unknown function (DUF1460)
MDHLHDPRSLMNPPLSRRALIRTAAASVAALVFPAPLSACRLQSPGRPADPSQARLAEWTRVLRAEGVTRRDRNIGRQAIRVGELAVGTPYEPYTLESYLQSGGNPSQEPLTLSLMRFDCVTLVESCLAVARVANDGKSDWERFGREVERMRYREGQRRGYTSRLHYFSEWIGDGEKRGLVKDMGRELGGAEDGRPLRFMTRNRAKYPALAHEGVFRQIAEIERGLDGHPRWVIPTKRIPQVVNRIETGDVLAFATEIPGLDVTHAAFAYRDRDDTLRVLHAPLSGGVVEVTRATLPEYVAAIRRSTGILVARPLPG